MQGVFIVLLLKTIYSFGIGTFSFVLSIASVSAIWLLNDAHALLSVLANPV